MTDTFSWNLILRTRGIDDKRRQRSCLLPCKWLDGPIELHTFATAEDKDGEAEGAHLTFWVKLLDASQ